jgi:hypothetical protein
MSRPDLGLQRDSTYAISEARRGNWVWAAVLGSGAKAEEEGRQQYPVVAV